MCTKQGLDKAQIYGMSLIWPETESICAQMYCSDYYSIYRCSLTKMSSSLGWNLVRLRHMHQYELTFFQPASWETIAQTIALTPPPPLQFLQFGHNNNKKYILFIARNVMNQILSMNYMRCRQSELSNITWQKSLLVLINKTFQPIISINWTSDVLYLKLKLKPKIKYGVWIGQTFPPKFGQRLNSGIFFKYFPKGS